MHCLLTFVGSSLREDRTRIYSFWCHQVKMICLNCPSNLGCFLLFSPSKEILLRLLAVFGSSPLCWVSRTSLDRARGSCFLLTVSLWTPSAIIFLRVDVSPSPWQYPCSYCQLHKQYVHLVKSWIRLHKGERENLYIYLTPW